MELTTLLTVRWDAPYRFLASVLGVMVLSLSAVGGRVFEDLATGAHAISWDWVATPLGWVDDWVQVYLVGIGGLFLTLTGVAAWFSCTPSLVIAKSRATASVWIFAAVSAYSFPVWQVLLAIIVGVAVRATANQLNPASPSFGRTWVLGSVHLVGGLAWAPFAVFVWPFETPRTRAEQLRQVAESLRV